MPRWPGNPFPTPTDYGTYTACRGLCMSVVSQADADLCAQRNAAVCENDNGGKGGPGKPKPTYYNTIQSCTVPATGRQVIVPAGLFPGDSVAEANAAALAYANTMQKDPRTPPGATVLPGPATDPPSLVINPIPIPTPQPSPKPTPPPASACKPCDDTSAVSTFSLVCNVPAGGNSASFESPLLKCGMWDFDISGYSGDPTDPAFSVAAVLVADDSGRTMVTDLDDCPNYPLSWNLPCSPGDCSGGRTDWTRLGFFPGCCTPSGSHCGEVHCQSISGHDYMCRLLVYYATDDGTPNFQPRQFTVNGTLTAPPSP